MYWSNQQYAIDNNHEMEFRARIALALIEKWGTVAGKTAGEDTAGRWKLALQGPVELVDRCFAIAEEFIRVAEAKGLLRQTILSHEEYAGLVGTLHGHAKAAEFDVSLNRRREPSPTTKE